jgi:hypothetical protein
MVEHLITPETQKTGIGFMAPEKVQRTIDYVSKARKIAKKPVSDEVYTNQFVYKVIPKKP